MKDKMYYTTLAVLFILANIYFIETRFYAAAPFFGILGLINLFKAKNIKNED